MYSPGCGTKQQLLKILGRQEREVCHLVSCGLRNKAIAARLGVRTRTVHSIVSRLFMELEVSNRVELTRFILAHPEALDGDAVTPGWAEG